MIKADRDIPTHEATRSTAEANTKPDTMESFRSYHSHVNTPKANKKKRRVRYTELFTVFPWVAGNEVIVKNVNAHIPVSLSWLLRPFLAFLCFSGSAQFIASSS